MKAIKLLSVREFDELVINTYSLPYSFQQQDDCKPRSTYKFSLPIKEPIRKYENETLPVIVNGAKMGVSFSSWKASDPKSYLNNFIKEGHDASWLEFCVTLWYHRNFYPHVDEILVDLYNRGILEAGDYAIDIDW